MLPVVRFGFSQSVYPVPEEDASGEGYILEVCVELFSGELDREFVIRVEGQDGSAVGKYAAIYMVYYLCFFEKHCMVQSKVYHAY